MRHWLLVLCATRAFAYTATVSSEGQPLHWNVPIVAVSIEDQYRSVLSSACTAWSALPESRVLIEPGDGAVKVVFRRDEWPYAHEMLALTSVVSHPDTGEIASAIVEVNFVDHQFEVGGARAANVAYDLQAVLTHELGHVLGLGHSEDSRATMFATTAPWDAHQQAPSEDDRAGIGYLYDRAPTEMPAAAGGCSVSASHRGDALGLSLMLCLLASLIWRQRQANPRAGVMTMTKAARQMSEVRAGRALR